METTRLIDPAFWASNKPAAPGSRFPADATDPEGLVWFRTSGSSGPPKWRGLSRDGLLLSASIVNAHLAVKADELWGLALPLNHVGGFGVIARAYEAGCPLACYQQRWNAVAFHTWLTQHEVNHLSLVPTQVHDLVNASLKAPSTLKTIVVGGGRLASPLGEKARALGWPVLASYGMTEAGSQIATQSLASLSQPYSPETLPILPHWSARIGESGCLEIRGESLFRASLLWKDRWCFEARSQPWFETEDRVTLESNRLTVLGRADRCVKILGELVDLSEIEQDLALEEASVVAVPDARSGHRLVLAHTRDDVVPTLERYHSNHTGPWRITSSVRFDRLPRTPLGKVRVDELIKMIASREK